MTSEPAALAPAVVERLLIDTEPWLSCDDCFRHVDEYVEKLLAGTDPGIPGMPEHLRGCPACAEEAETLLALLADDAGMDPTVALALLP